MAQFLLERTIWLIFLITNNYTAYLFILVTYFYIDVFDYN